MLPPAGETLAYLSGQFWVQPAPEQQAGTHAPPHAARNAGQKVPIEIAHHNSTVRLVVAEAGPGFPPELLPHAFERFTRGDTSRGRSGTGLGLAIVSSLTTALGGRVTAANGPPLGGATVTVELRSTRRAPQK